MEKKIFGRGGRLTKWKGRVASVAPAMVFAVVGGGAFADCTPSNTGTAGNDTLTCDATNDPAGSDIVTLAGDDTVHFSAGQSGGIYLDEDGGVEAATDGNDTLIVDGGDFTKNLYAGGGDDTLKFVSGGSSTASSYTGGAIMAGSGNDTIILYGAIIGGINAGEGDDLIEIYSGRVFPATRGDAGNDIITIYGGRAGHVRGGDGEDAITVLNGSVGAILSDAGDDYVIIGGGEAYYADGGAGNDVLELSGGKLIGGAGRLGDLDGGIGDDEISIIAGGTVAGDVIGGTGNDTLTLSGGVVEGLVNAGEGDDIAEWTGTDLSEIQMGDGSDSLEVNTAEFGGSDLSTITILDGGDDVATADGFIDTLTLWNETATLSGANVLNWETVELDASEVSFSDGALTTGEEDGYGLFLNSGTTLDVSGGFDLTGSLTNGALLTAMDDTAGDQIAVSGSYTGDGGTIELDAELGDDSSAADTLKVAGDVTGTSSIYVNVVGGEGAETDLGILLVEVSGTSAADAFSLANELEAGAFTYGLEYSNPDDSASQNWYLRSTGTSGGGAAFESAPGVLLAFSELSTLEQRVGQRQWWGRDSEARGPLQPAEGAWIRMNASQSHTMADSTSGAELETTKWLLQAGWDAMLSESDTGRWVLGGFVQAGTISSDLTTETSSAKIDGTGFGLGITGTWYGNSGTYVDLQSLVSLTRADYSSAVAGELANDQDATALAFSAEVGHRMAVSEHTALVPQAQLSYARIWGGEFTDNQGTEVDLGTNDSLIGRLGLAYEYEYSEGWLFGDRAAAGPQHQREKVYAIANILHDFSDDSSVSVGGADLAASGQDTWGEIGLGGSMTWDENKVVYTEGSYRRAFDQGDDNWGASVEVGFRMSW
nr:autotransporter outer membrane beta-barrel domain-containing protein [uncultured Celeribacter sp.]